MHCFSTLQHLHQNIYISSFPSEPTHRKLSHSVSLHLLLKDMAKVTGSGLYFIRRMSFSVATEQLQAQTPASMVVRKVKAAMETGGRDDVTAAEQKETFWMKDPKSGNWIPESHFGEIDVAELREKFLPTRKLSNK